MAITLSGTTITMNDASTIVSTTTFGAIGSFGKFFNIQTSATSPNGTIAGSSLRSLTAGISAGGGQIQSVQGGITVIGNHPGGVQARGTSSGNWGAIPGTGVSGTWRNMNNLSVNGAFHQTNEMQQNLAAAGLFARVS